jgi:hypothetical protein
MKRLILSVGITILGMVGNTLLAHSDRSETSLSSPCKTKTEATKIFKFLKIRQRDKDISVVWVVNSPNDVSWFTIERSDNGESFELISDAYCGSDSTHRFLDSSILSGVIYYRVKADLKDGTSQYSEVGEIRIAKAGGKK